MQGYSVYFIIPIFRYFAILLPNRIYILCKFCISLSATRMCLCKKIHLDSRPVLLMDIIETSTSIIVYCSSVLQSTGQIIYRHLHDKKQVSVHPSEVQYTSFDSTQQVFSSYRNIIQYYRKLTVLPRYYSKLLANQISNFPEILKLLRHQILCTKKSSARIGKDQNKMRELDFGDFQSYSSQSTLLFSLNQGLSILYR